MNKLQKELHFAPELLKMSKRLANAPKSEETILLNRNELPFELEMRDKKMICKKLEEISWNRYPKPSYPDLEEQIAKYAGVEPGNIVVGAGAAYLITLLFNVFNKKQIVLPNPSFSLFNYHCSAYGLDYVHWDMDEELRYDLSLFPQIKENALIVIDSPNNPTGSCISEEMVLELLEKYKQAIFLIDEVYFEFSQKTFKLLVQDYENVIIIRSFSKAFGLAGARIAYLIAAETMANELRKLVLPFVVNQFGYTVAKHVLSDSGILSHMLLKIELVLKLKKEFIKELQKDTERLGYSIIGGLGNFFLMTFNDSAGLKKAIESLKKVGIAVLDVSNNPNLGNTIRVSVGNEFENHKFIDALQNLK